MKGSYKVREELSFQLVLVCDMKMKGSYKGFWYQQEVGELVCDMKMKGSYKVKSVEKKPTHVYDIQVGK